MIYKLFSLLVFLRKEISNCIISWISVLYFIIVNTIIYIFCIQFNIYFTFLQNPFFIHLYFIAKEELFQAYNDGLNRI